MAQAEPVRRPNTVSPGAAPGGAMAQAEPVKKVNIEEGKNTVIPGKAPGGAPAGTPMAAASPVKEKLMNEGEAASRSVPQSPSTPPMTDGKLPRLLPGERGSNLKAEAFADAHTTRVESEAQSFIDAEVRKAAAHAEKMQAVAEKEKMVEEAEAIKNRKNEEHRAEEVVHAAVLKADRIIAEAKDKAALIKANAKEAQEKHIAEAYARSEKEKAAQEEAKSRRMADIKDQAETMIAAGEFASMKRKGLGQKIKENLTCASF